MAANAWTGAVTRRPGLIVAVWLAAVTVVTLAAPDLGRVSAQQQTALLPDDAPALAPRSWSGRPGRECCWRGRSRAAPMTSAATVIVGLSTMGATRFKLFSSTGPSVAVGLAVTLLASLTLAPAALLLLARDRPRSFAGPAPGVSSFWEEVGRRVLERPVA